MTPEGFESTISAGKRPQMCVLDRAATGTGNKVGSICTTQYHEAFMYCSFLSNSSSLMSFHPRRVFLSKFNVAGNTKSYQGVDKSLARPGRKQATAIKL